MYLAARTLRYLAYRLNAVRHYVDAYLQAKRTEEG